MGWSTSVIAPPDGDMAAYRASLAKLLKREDAIYWPTHGPAIIDPKTHVAAFMAHRQEREDEILARLSAGDTTVMAMVEIIYAAVDKRLYPAAARSVLAHLVELVANGKVLCDGAPGLETRYWLP
jgi:glyoxylase-like metal-dependent hydrolase (beta-lactamase superfamily II)